MKEITVEIGKFFDFLKEKHNVEFTAGEFSKSPFPVYIKDEKDELVEVTDWIEKKSAVYEVEFDNGMKKKLADKHLISVEPFFEPEKCTTRYAEDWEPGDDIPYLQTKCVSNKKISDEETVYGFSVASEKHLYKDADGMIHHNTYTANKIVNSYREECGKEIVYESGDLGAALSNIVPFFFMHSQNKLIVLDDNDRMLMKGNQGTANFMKGILDPDTKPVSVGSSILKAATKNLQDLIGDPLDESKEKVIDIDLQSLREGYFRMNVNGECVQDDYIGLQEAQELSNIVRPLRESEKRQLRRHLREADSFFDEEPPAEEPLDTASGAVTIPRTFIFNSSVIFISNLEFKDISPAVLDRCESIEVKLTLEQFMTRLEGVLKSLCKGHDYSSTPQELRDWGKGCVYTLLGAVIEAFYHNATLFSTKIEIRRKFTFRMFEEFVVYWVRWGRHWAEKRGIDMSDINQLKKLEPELVETTLRDKIIPWISKSAD